MNSPGHQPGGRSQLKRPGAKVTAPLRLDQATDLDHDPDPRDPKVLIVRPRPVQRSGHHGLLLALPLFVVCLILFLVRLGINDWQGIWTEGRNRLSSTPAGTPETEATADPESPAFVRDDPERAASSVVAPVQEELPFTATERGASALPTPTPAPDLAGLDSPVAEPDPTQTALDEIAREAERKRAEREEMERLKQEMARIPPRPAEPAPVGPIHDWEAAQRQMARLMRDDRTRQRQVFQEMEAMQREWLAKMAEMGIDPRKPMEGFAFPGGEPPPLPSLLDGPQGVRPGQWPPVPSGNAPQRPGTKPPPSGVGAWPPTFGLGADPSQIRRFDFQNGQPNAAGASEPGVFGRTLPGNRSGSR